MTPRRIGTMRRWREWCAASILVLSLCLANGCSGVSDPSAETAYVLSSIAGVSLPAPFDVATDTEGNVWTLEMVESRLTLLPDNTFQRTMSAVRKLNGEVIAPIQLSTSGSFERRGQFLIVRYPSGAGYDDVVEYENIDGGRQLSGAHSTGAVYRWLRADAVR